jgi:hypothetical protein
MDLYKNIAYAPLDIKFDRAAWQEEYDERILPAAKPFISILESWDRLRRYNPSWQVLDAETFSSYDAAAAAGNHQLEGNASQWLMVNLLQAQGDQPSGGGANWRYRNLHNPKFLKPQFKDLRIVEWLYDTLPADEIVGIHCVSIEPRAFSAPHRDAGYWDPDKPHPASRNGYYQLGYVVITFNITNGGVPLLWALDHQQDSPSSVDDDCYMISDYFMHAVPQCTSRRRQIRVSMRPTAALQALIAHQRAVVIPDDYRYEF